MMLTVACDIWIVSIRHTGGDLGDWKILVSILMREVNWKVKRYKVTDRRQNFA